MTLTLLALVPLVGAVVIALIAALTHDNGRLAARVAAVFSLAALVFAVVLACAFDPDGGRQFVTDVDWIVPMGAHFALALDGLGLLMVLLTVVMVPVVIAASWRAIRSPAYFAWVLALEGLGLTVFLADDLLVFYIAFEATLIPAYFLIGGWGRHRRAGAALKFLLFQLGGGLVLLAGVIGVGVVSADQRGAPTLLLPDLVGVDFSGAAGKWIFVAFFIAFAVKAPLFPLHTWLADTTEQATAPTSVLLVCVLDKIGTFAMLRLCLGLFPEASAWATPVVVALALISILYGALLAIGADDLLRLIGLTSLSHFGFITLGIFVISPDGSAAAILYMLAHGLATGALLLAAGFLYERHGTVSIRALAALGGAEARTPVLAGLFLVAGMATLGLPGLAQFAAEIVVIINAFAWHWYVGALALPGLVLAAVYVLWAYQRIFTGPPASSPESELVRSAGPDASAARAASGAVMAGGVRDLTLREVAVLAPLVAGMVVLGFAPGVLLELVTPTVTALVQAGGR